MFQANERREGTEEGYLFELRHGTAPAGAAVNYARDTRRYVHLAASGWVPGAGSSGCRHQLGCYRPELCQRPRSSSFHAPYSYVLLTVIFRSTLYLRTVFGSITKSGAGVPRS